MSRKWGMGEKVRVASTLSWTPGGHALDVGCLNSSLVPDRTSRAQLTSVPARLRPSLQNTAALSETTRRTRAAPSADGSNPTPR